MISRGRPKAILLSLFLGTLLVACNTSASKTSAQPDLHSWPYASLRLIDPPDADLPEQDLVAVYFRELRLAPVHPVTLFSALGFQETELQVRLDFLDLSARSTQDIYIALDHAPGGTYSLPLTAESELEWDTLLVLPAGGQFQALDSSSQPRSGISLRVLRDPLQDYITVTWDPCSMTAVQPPCKLVRLAAQVFIAPPKSATITDRSRPWSIYDPPPQPAPLLLAFWNTFPAYTPAQALRRWDGAHSGPLGGRHGLYNLLRTARANNITIALLDLKHPLSLSALDYAEGADLVRQMVDAGLLILPDLLLQLPDLPAQSLTGQRWINSSALPGSNLLRPLDPGSEFSFNAEDTLLSGVGSRFAFLPSSVPGSLASLYRWQQRTVMTLPGYGSSNDPLLQPTPDGLSLEARRQLLSVALAADPQGRLERSSILLLGGDLPQSSWGAPEVARAAFAYLRSHPWIRPLTASDLLTAHPYSELPQTVQIATASSYASVPLLLTSSTYALTAPLYPAAQELPGLRAHYAGQLLISQAASEWSASPYTAATCHRDLDRDGQPECLLASEHTFAVFDPSLGALTHLFALTNSGLHQIIAPTSELILGLTDPRSWDLSMGLRADPAVIPGAFSDESLQIEILLSESQIVFTAIDRQLEKRYVLLPHGILFEQSSAKAHPARLLLSLDPWLRFTSTWAGLYQGQLTANQFEWSAGAGLTVQVRSSSPLEVQAFNDSRRFFGELEDPNQEYPAGHYLPFPLILLQFTPQQVLDVELSW